VAQQEVRDAQAAQAEIQANLNYGDQQSNGWYRDHAFCRTWGGGCSRCTLLTLVNLDELYLRGFIPEGQIGHGQSRSAGLSRFFPKQPLLAKVTRVDPKASFTPENTFPKTELLRCLASNLPSKIPKAWLN